MAGQASRFKFARLFGLGVFIILHLFSFFKNSGSPVCDVQAPSHQYLFFIESHKNVRIILQNNMTPTKII
jgi:hypothetical protein